MGKLVITGNDRMLQIIVKENRLRASRHGLEVNFTPDKKAEKPQPKEAKDIDVQEDVVTAVEAKVEENQEATLKEEEALPASKSKKK